jgi:hypothetical protein
MIPISKLLTITDVITHDSCADGVATAILIHDVLPDVKIHFLQYNTPEYRAFTPGPNQLWCDFSPLPERAQEFVDAGALVLDHHKTAKAVVAMFGENGVFGDEVTDPGVCGAVLAYREVWLPLHQVRLDLDALAYAGTLTEEDDLDELRQDSLYEVAEAAHFAHLSGVRDTWQTKDPFWGDASVLVEALRFMPIEAWLAIKRPFKEANLKLWQDRKSLGKVLIEKHQKTVKRAVEGAYGFTTPRGTRVKLFSGHSPIASDAAELLGREADLVVGFGYVGIEADGVAKVVFSVRSHTDFDCASFCKSLGGGGHTKAAGFAIQFDPRTGSQDPYSLFASALGRYESNVAAAAIQA